MNTNSNDLLNSMLEGLSKVEFISLEDIPGIELYMDQVTTLMENALSFAKRHEEDKILTKTMINNYAKNNLLPPPVKKKYSREHVLVLIFIYYFKNVLSIKDIESVLKPITEKHFHTENPLQIDQIYEEICGFEQDHISDIHGEIQRLYKLSRDTFTDVAEEERSDLQLFSFICSLSTDIYIKKLLVERLIDHFHSTKENIKKEKNTKEKKEKSKT